MQAQEIHCLPIHACDVLMGNKTYILIRTMGESKAMTPWENNREYRAYSTDKDGMQHVQFIYADSMASAEDQARELCTGCNRTFTGIDQLKWPERLEEAKKANEEHDHAFSFDELWNMATNWRTCAVGECLEPAETCDYSRIEQMVKYVNDHVYEMGLDFSHAVESGRYDTAKYIYESIKAKLTPEVKAEIQGLL